MEIDLFVIIIYYLFFNCNTSKYNLRNADDFPYQDVILLHTTDVV